jgi:TonB family protein
MKNKIAFLVIVVALLLSSAAYSQQDQASPKPDTRKVQSDVLQPVQLIHKNDPIYPPEAKAKRIKGTVVVEFVVDKEGNVTNASMVSGPPPLRDTVLAAIKEWKYKPATLEGKPIEQKVQVRFDFENKSTRPPDSQKAPSDNYQPPKLMHSTDPIYPPEVKARRMSGTVVLEVLVDKEGNVANAKLIMGPPIVRDATEAAIKEWKYRPATLQGKPVEETIQVRCEMDRDVSGHHPSYCN